MEPEKDGKDGDISCTLPCRVMAVCCAAYSQMVSSDTLEHHADDGCMISCTVKMTELKLINSTDVHPQQVKLTTFVQSFVTLRADKPRALTE